MVLNILKLVLRILNKISKEIEKIVKKSEEKKWWKKRVAIVLKSSDNKFIPRHLLAGKIENGYQIMHNGQKIICGSYYGNDVTKMLIANKGVHEPQEERVFGEVLKDLGQNSIMVELGSYWAFYSMWFLQKNPNGKSILYEPSLENMKFGEENFKLNGLKGDFNQAFVSSNIDLNTSPCTVNLPYIFEQKKIKFLDILHSDIQGFELELLEGGRDILAEGKVGYLFISTHSNEIHSKCLKIIMECGFILISEANLDESFSYDGIIVARFKSYNGIKPIAISKKILN